MQLRPGDRGFADGPEASPSGNLNKSDFALILMAYVNTQTAVPKLADLLQDPEQLSQLPVEAIPSLLGELERLRTTLWARLIQPGNSESQNHPTDMLLTAEQAGPILGVTPRWLYRHAPKLPFARRLSRKTLRFSETGLRKWQAQKRA
jgi:hypothetical protein